MASETIAALLKTEALRLGFDLAGVCRAVAPPGIERFRQWLAAGHAGGMSYMADRAGAYEHPRRLLAGARSVLMLGVNYRTEEPALPGVGQARISRYAWGAVDYHDYVRQRLHALADFHRVLNPAAEVRGVVDTAPLLEREFAQMAGLGWIGKNTMLINRRWGSWIFLAALLTSEELDADQPLDNARCETCRACLDACPTGALVGPYQLDARRCLSYLTIEHQGPMSEELRPRPGGRLFGCDACQEACPWNRRTPAATGSALSAFEPAPNGNPIELAALLAMDEAAFRATFRKTPLWRARRDGVLANAAYALGSQPQAGGLPTLLRGLRDASPTVRAACAWAIGRDADPAAEQALRDRLTDEADASVRAEIEAAIKERPSHEPEP